MDASQLVTPAFLIDLSVLKSNARFMQERARELGVRLRPHVKTHKSVEAARIQIDGGFGGITVSTLAEARFFKEGGFSDITYAVPVGPDKLPAAAALQREMEKLSLLVDTAAGLAFVEDYAARENVRFNVFLKVDCGYHRAGVDPGGGEALEIARRIDESSFLDFEGILTHAGHAYKSRDAQKTRKVARQERDTMVRFAERLEEAGIGSRTISVGSTPTAAHADHLEGVTEMRPGNYLFFDKFQADVHSCRLAQCSATVLASVVSHQHNPPRILIDAGALALSKDRGADHIQSETVYGAIQGHRHLRISSLSQEHGIVTSRGPIDFGKHRIGSRLRIIPNHSCLTAACFPEYHVVEGEEVVDVWKPVRGWR